jgi:hypothetical protein
MFALRMFSATAAAFALFIAAGCQSSVGHGSQDITRSEHAVVFTAGNGGATTVSIPSVDNNPVDALSRTGSRLIPYAVDAGNGGTTTILIPSASNIHAESVASVESEVGQ